MKKIFVFAFCFILSAGVLATAQSRTTKLVTNADLEKYRQKRIEADKDYRENYKQRGMPSPEEIDKRIEESRARRDELSAKLRVERLERERIEAEQLNNQRLLLQLQQQYANPQLQYSYSGLLGSGFYWSYGPQGWYKIYRPMRLHQQSYLAGGAFWPAPTNQFPKRQRPAFIQVLPRNR